MFYFKDTMYKRIGKLNFVFKPGQLPVSSLNILFLSCLM